MGITKIIDSFYTELGEGYLEKPQIGQLCWAPITYHDLIPRILDVEREHPEEHLATKFKIRNMNTSDFRDKEKLPIKHLSLRNTEELIISKAKKRPAIIATTENTCYSDIAKLLKNTGQEHLQVSNVLTVVPIFSISSEDHQGGFPQEMVLRIRTMMYNQFMFLPKQNVKNSIISNDSVARLDKIQILHHESGVCNLQKWKLSDDALGVLLALLRERFGSESEELHSLRELLHDIAPPIDKITG